MNDSSVRGGESSRPTSVKVSSCTRRCQCLVVWVVAPNGPLWLLLGGGPATGALNPPDGWNHAPQCKHAADWSGVLGKPPPTPDRPPTPRQAACRSATTTSPGRLRNQVPVGGEATIDGGEPARAPHRTRFATGPQYSAICGRSSQFGNPPMAGLWCCRAPPAADPPRAGATPPPLHPMKLLCGGFVSPLGGFGSPTDACGSAASPPVFSLWLVLAMPLHTRRPVA